MSEKLLSFFLSELATVRVVCRGVKAGTPCGAVVEMPLARLKDAFLSVGVAAWECPFCRTPFHLHLPNGNPRDPFTPLVNAILDLENIKDRVEIQFIIPGKD